MRDLSTGVDIKINDGVRHKNDQRHVLIFHLDQAEEHHWHIRPVSTHTSYNTEHGSGSAEKLRSGKGRRKHSG